MFQRFALVGSLALALPLALLAPSPLQAQGETCALLAPSGEGLAGQSLQAAESRVRETLSGTEREVMPPLAVSRALREAGESPCGEPGCVSAFLQACGAQMAVSVTVLSESGSSTPFRVRVSLTDGQGNRVNATMRIEGEDISRAAELATHDALARWNDRQGIPFRVTGSPAGASVIIDGEPFGTLPVAEGRLSTGPHLVAVGHEGYLTFTRRIEVGTEPGDGLEVTLRARPGAEPPAPSLSAEAPSPWTTRRWVGVTLAATGTLAAGGLLIAGATGTRCVEENSAGCVVTREPSGAHYALVGVAAAVAATGFVLWILPPGEEEDEPLTSVGLTPTGVTLRYRY